MKDVTVTYDALSRDVRDNPHDYTSKERKEILNYRAPAKKSDPILKNVMTKAGFDKKFEEKVERLRQKLR